MASTAGASSEGPLELDPEDRTLPVLLSRQAERLGERELVRHAAGSRSYRDTLDAVARLAGALRAAGVEPGDRVAVFAANRLELLDTVLAAGWLGAVAVPVNIALRAAQLAHVLENADPRLLVADPAFVPVLDDLVSLPTSLERVWLTERAAGGSVGAVPLEPFPAGGDPVEPHAVGPMDPFLILYTSGTTGPSKGVVCPHAQLYWWGRLTARYLDVRGTDVLHTVLPMFHMNALNTFFQAGLAGAVYSFGPRFSASRFWDEVRDREATVTYLLGAMVLILLGREPGVSERSHRVRVALSPATPQQAVEAFRARFGVALVDGYGSTETNLVFCNRVGDHRPGTMGRVVPEFEARVVDENDEDLPDGVPGELVLRHSEPYSFASGYFRRPESTVEAWRNLWFHTGDRVVRDTDGVWRFVDRLKDAIRRRGENISSAEVEDALLTHQDVALAAAVGVPSELGEEEVMAFVVLRSGALPDPGGLTAHLEPRLAYFAIPRYLEFVDELPLTENGKVQKAPLRERGVGEHTWDREAAGFALEPRDRPPAGAR
jgi:crotonobetaine/carnitine-CoA ligase